MLGALGRIFAARPPTAGEKVDGELEAQVRWSLLGAGSGFQGSGGTCWVQVPGSVVRRCLLGADACFKYSGGACLVQVPDSNTQGVPAWCRCLIQILKGTRSMRAWRCLLDAEYPAYSRSGVARNVGARSIRAAKARLHW